ncbi:hypothetical protein [Mariniblastus fucicola]|uniref:Virus attachment protein p12 family protein n=1 Tax=Mariniblastus fucicola TaxID=980251 RepID=A0A5B9PIK3_9BACT|nr:hypothetical protein [Mariniblastus fucicola]QEG25105.1 hypothetical protein MFFC18_50280 [Mariniblastus fucicola]
MDWQTIVALIAVAGALMFVLSRLYRITTRPDSGCGGSTCSSCPASHPEYSVKQVPLVQIGDE